MVLSVLLTAWLASGVLPTQVPAQAPENIEVAFVAEVTAGHFCALNASDEPQLALFGGPGGSESYRIVPAHGSLDLVIPHGAQGLYWVEFASFANDRRRTGPLALDDLVGSTRDTVWVTGESAGDARWLRAVSARPGTTFVVPKLAAVTTALDRAGWPLPEAAGSSPLPPAAPHVPGVNPDQDDNGDTPPDIGDTPLPPF